MEDPLGAERFAALIDAVRRGGADALGPARQALDPGDPADAAWAAFLDRHAPRIAPHPEPMLLSLALEDPADGVVGAAVRAWLAAGSAHAPFLRVRPRTAPAAPRPRFSLCPGDTAGDANDLAVDAAGRVAVVSLRGHRGRIFPTASAIVAWSLPDRRLLAHVPGDRAWLNAVAVSPDGTWAIGVGRGRRPIRVDLATGASKVLKQQRRELECVAVSPDGERFVTGCAGGTIRVWHRAGGVLATFDAHQGYVWDLVVSPDGERIVSLGWDGAVRVWSLDGRLSNEWGLEQEHARRLVQHPDGSLFVDDAADAVTRTRPDGVEIARYPIRSSVFALDAAGGRLAADHEDGVMIWDVETGAPLGMVPGARAGSALAFAGDTLLVTHAYEPHLHAFDLATLGSAPVSESPAVGFVESTADARHAVTSASSAGRLGRDQAERGARTTHPDGPLVAWDLPAGGRCIGELAGARTPHGLLHGGRAWSATEDGALALWDLATAERRWTVPGRLPAALHGDDPGRVVACAFPGGRHLALLALADGGEAVEVVDLDDGTRVAAFPVVPRVRGLVAVDPAPCVVWSAGEALHRSGPHGWSVASGVVRSVRVDEARGHVLGAVGAAVRVWSLADGRPLDQVTGRSKATVYGVDLLPGGDLVTIADDGKVRRVGRSTGRVLWTSRAFARSGRVVAAHPDGEVVYAVGGMFDEVLLDARTGAVVRRPWSTRGGTDLWPGVAGYAVGSYERTLALVPFVGDRIPWVAAAPGTFPCVAADGAVVVGHASGGLTVLEPVG